MKELTIVPLGTISPYSKKNMNCPGFLIKYHDKKILLDCGSGITRLLRFPNDLNNLYVIITHFHKDHFGDIGAIQYASYIYGNQVKIYLPKNDFEFNKKSIILNKYCCSQYFDISDNYSFYIDDLKISFKDNKSHNIESYMVKLENNDFKVIYTSDIGITNFNDLILYCNQSDLIICESSLLKKHNKNNCHMTAYDAGTLARKSLSKKLLLTHFWPEESKEIYLNEAKEVFENTDVARENHKIILRRS